MITQCAGQRSRMPVLAVSATGFAAAAVIAADALFGSVVAVAGPAAVGGAQGVIDMLTSEGYRVIVTKVGGRDIEDCTVRSILTQSPVHHLHTSDIRPAPARGQEPPDFKMAYVTLNCA
ncbi:MULTISPECIES: hypothetical protein [unclassified Mycobacterium]|uniref:hypothetical protein n=1 Tax=unclassified Mycobacterium TaxID=2642494 RepID=UPI0011162830|nr:MULTISPECIES: hypothetical protein [unclassified Mycobacterium]